MKNFLYPVAPLQFASIRKTVLRCLCFYFEYRLNVLHEAFDSCRSLLSFIEELTNARKNECIFVSTSQMITILNAISCTVDHDVKSHWNYLHLYDVANDIACVVAKRCSIAYTFRSFRRFSRPTHKVFGKY